MKKIDKLVLISFVGPFIITFLVVVFIMLSKQMLSYFDDIIGKGLDWITIGHLLFYFAIFMIPVAMPLAVLLSSLITFGNLGEHFELTAIKGAGISLLRILRPIFLFVVVITVIAFYVNDMLVPRAALQAYSLLWDIKQKKPALELREGEFYAGIPDIDIKVQKKKKVNGKDMLYGIIIYDHRNHNGNTDITVADSGRMYTILNDEYLKFDLYHGYNYSEGRSAGITNEVSNTSGKNTLSRSQFKESQFVFDLSSFKLTRTDQKWFETNRIMRNIGQLDHDLDSMQDKIVSQRLNFYIDRRTFFTLYNAGSQMPAEVLRRKAVMDSMGNLPRQQPASGDTANHVVKAAPKKSPTAVHSPKKKPAKKGGQTGGSTPKKKAPKKKSSSKRKPTPAKTFVASTHGLPVSKTQRHPVVETVRRFSPAQLDSLYKAPPTFVTLDAAASYARRVKNLISSNATNLDNYRSEYVVYAIQWHKIITASVACIVMFLIGAPLGSIIKRGGLGIPFLVSIFFFIIFYLLTMFGEKYAKEGAIGVVYGTWLPDFILMLIGMFFLRQARIDARLFETDFYLVMWDKLKIAYRRMRGRPEMA